MILNTWPGWQSVRLLGEGSFGRVYEIKREDYGFLQRAALKVMTIPQSSTELDAAYATGMDKEDVRDYFYSMVQELVAEFKLMDQLKGNNMNIVSYEDHMVLEHENDIGWDILIRMELLTPLTAYAAAHPLSEGDVIRLGVDMCRALAMCREKGIIHRDIKPENIFYAEDTGHFKLGDFGVARIADRNAGNFSRKGTYNYMAPEIYFGESYGYAVDIYSLGLVLYRYLNDGRLPFLPDGALPISYSDNEEAFKRRMNGEIIPAPNNGSPALKAAVVRACAFDPAKRFRSPKEMADALTGRAQEVESRPSDRRNGKAAVNTGSVSAQNKPTKGVGVAAVGMTVAVVVVVAVLIVVLMMGSSGGDNSNSLKNTGLEQNQVSEIIEDNDIENGAIETEASDLSDASSSGASWADIESEAVYLEYAIVLSVVQEKLAYCESSWTLKDADNDGTEELLVYLVNTSTEESEASGVIMLVDGDTGEISVFTEESLTLSYDSSSFDNPTLESVDFTGSTDSLKQELDAWLTATKTVDDSFEDDYSDSGWEADGVNETIYFVSGAADTWFAALVCEDSDAEWALEAFENYIDNYETCFVVFDTESGIQVIVTRI